MRPFGKSVVGPDGAVWTGWAARYGVYGGGLSRVDPESLEFTSWYDPVPKQSIIGIGSDDRRIYFITSGYGCGLPEQAVSRRLVAWDPKGEIAWQHGYPEDVRLTSLSVGHGVVVVGAGTELHLFDPRAESLTGHLALTDPRYCTVPLPDGHFAVFTGCELLLLDPRTASLSKLCDLPDRDLATATATPDGTLHFIAGSHLFRVSE